MTRPSAPSRRGPLVAFMVKEIQHILRDRQTLTILMLMPLLQVLLFGYALRTDIQDIRVAVVDPTPDYATLALRNRLGATDRFTIVQVLPDASRLETLFRRNQADVGVELAPRFGARLARGEPADIQLIADASDPNGGTTMAAYVDAVIDDFATQMGASGGAVHVALDTRMRFNPTLASVNLFVPGLIALVITLVSALMTAISLSREKERGTLESLLVSPLRPWQIIVGKVLPYLGLGLTIVLLVLTAAWGVFRVPFRGSLALLLGEALLYTLVSLALGVLIAARTSSQRSAMLGALVGTMMPNALLSGMIFPIASMPAWLRAVTYVVPARWFIIIARGVMLEGVGVVNLWAQTCVLVLMTIVLLVAAVRSFDARLA
ncbi:MAG TPA: ABC transporter permease [Gemmatimonadaceae bacterium]|nr:ABC transporter permease [Gemmatimonadaceae bacterium]